MKRISEKELWIKCSNLPYLHKCTGAVAYRYAYFGRGSGPILMDDVSCIGSERALINCSYDRSTVDCSHYEDAGVRCQCKWLVITEDTCDIY